MADSPTPLTWSRPDHTRRSCPSHRRLTRADVAAIDALRSSACVSSDPTTDDTSDLRHARALLVDQQIVGWLLAHPHPVPHDLPREPWASIDPPLPTQPRSSLAPHDSALRITELGWCDHPQLQHTATTQIPVELCQLFGFAQVLHLFEPPSWRGADPLLSPAAFVQQLHSGPLTDPRLTPMLQSGWRLDGWRPTSDGHPAVLVRWLNPVHA